MQNNVIGSLLNASPRTHIEEFKKVGLLPVQLRVEQQKLNNMFNSIIAYAPKYLCFQMTVVHSHYIHNTRASVCSWIMPRVNPVARGSFLLRWWLVVEEPFVQIKLLHLKGAFTSQVKSFFYGIRL